MVWIKNKYQSSVNYCIFLNWSALDEEENANLRFITRREKWKDENVMGKPVVGVDLLHVEFVDRVGQLDKFTTEPLESSSVFKKYLWSFRELCKRKDE